MANNVSLNSITGAIVLYTPPKSAEQIINSEVVKHAHQLYTSAVLNNSSLGSVLKESQLLKVEPENFLRWKHVTNTMVMKQNDPFLSILHERQILPHVLSFLDFRAVCALAKCSKEFNEELKTPLDRIERLLNAGAKWNDIDSRYDFIEIALAEKASAKTIQSLIEAGVRLDDSPTCTISTALKNKASSTVIKILIAGGAKLDSTPNGSIPDAIELGASKDVIQALINGGATVDEFTLERAKENSSADIIELLEAIYLARNLLK